MSREYRAAADRSGGDVCSKWRENQDRDLEEAYQLATDTVNSLLYPDYKKLDTVAPIHILNSPPQDVFDAIPNGTPPHHARDRPNARCFNITDPEEHPSKLSASFLSDVAMSPPSPSPNHSRWAHNKFHSSNDSLSSSSYTEDLHGCELQLKRKRAYIERVIEQQENLSEQKRLNDINQLCKRIQSAEVTEKPHHKSSRIKTNGSLPRERCCPDSPGRLRSSSSEDIQHLLFNSPLQGAVPPLEESDHKASRAYCSADDAPPPPRLFAQSAAPGGHAGGILDSSPASPLSVPGSPRRGIKTVLSKEAFSFPQEITNEVLEQCLDLSEDARSGRRTPPNSWSVATQDRREPPKYPGSPAQAPQASSRTLPNPKRSRFPQDRRPRPEGPEGHVSTAATYLETPSSVMTLEFVRKEILKMMSAMTGLKARLSEIENQEEEWERSVALEQACVKAELKTMTDKENAQRMKIHSLQKRADRCQKEMDLWQENRNAQQTISLNFLKAADRELNRLLEQLSHCEDGDTKEDIKNNIHIQTDVVDSEKKSYEDLEFKYLEEESVWLAKKEELSQELSEALKKCDEYSTRISELETLMDVGQQENFTEQRKAYLKRLLEGQTQLNALQSRYEELVRQNAGTTGFNRSEDHEGYLRDAVSTDDLDSTASEPFAILNGLSSMESSFSSAHHLSLPLGAEAGMEGVAGGGQTSTPTEESQVLQAVLWSSSPKDHRHLQPDDDPAIKMAAAQRAVLPGRSDAPQPAPRAAHAAGAAGAPGADAGLGGVARPASNGRVSRTPRPDAPQQPHGGRTASRQQRPLTRYLPVRRGDLDLRQHVESAGHAVALCDQVAVDACSCRGPLYKASARFGNWQKRWFVFDRSTRLLAYFKNRKERRPRGGVHFQSIAEVYVDHMAGHKHSHPNCVFVVKTTERSYHLMAPSPEAMRIWVDVIITGAEAYQEFD